MPNSIAVASASLDYQFLLIIAIASLLITLAAAPVAVTSASLDYQFLLIIHMICADQQIHSKEANSLRELASQAAIDQQTLDEMERILAQEQHISLEAVVQSVPRNQRGESIQQLLAIAF